MESIDVDCNLDVVVNKISFMFVGTGRSCGGEQTNTQTPWRVSSSQ